MYLRYTWHRPRVDLRRALSGRPVHSIRVLTRMVFRSSAPTDRTLPRRRWKAPDCWRSLESAYLLAAVRNCPEKANPITECERPPSCGQAHTAAVLADTAAVLLGQQSPRA